MKSKICTHHFELNSYNENIFARREIRLPRRSGLFLNKESNYLLPKISLEIEYHNNWLQYFKSTSMTFVPFHQVMVNYISTQDSCFCFQYLTLWSCKISFSLSDLVLVNQSDTSPQRSVLRECNIKVMYVALNQRPFDLSHWNLIFNWRKDKGACIQSIKICYVTLYYHTLYFWSWSLKLTSHQANIEIQKSTR